MHKHEFPIAVAIFLCGGLARRPSRALTDQLRLLLHLL